MGEQTNGPPAYIHLEQNDFLSRKHKKQKEEDIVTCCCIYNANNPDSACGERCLNVLTSTECTPGYCSSYSYCKNQIFWQQKKENTFQTLKFQKCEYAKSRLFKTEGRGWGLLADENIRAGQFVIEYCGEVISRKEAKRRSHAYENQGLRDAFIICLDAHESIDATRKGSLARFINHSCQPNCETRKWTVLGEVRVGIFAKQDIPAGAELSYDYNFEWYGGAKVRCLCGAASCSGFLGAKSRGFQEDTYLWEDDDDRYSIENVPLYDTEEDEPTSKLLKIANSSKFGSNTILEHSMKLDFSLKSDYSTALVLHPLSSVPVEGGIMNDTKIKANEEKKLYVQHTNQTFSQKNAMISRIRSNSACRNYFIQTSPVQNKRSLYSNGRSKHLAQKQVDPKLFAERLASIEAKEEIYDYEEKKKQGSLQLDLLYNEIRPAIEEHERDSQDNVSTSVAEKWIEASCSKLKAEFDLYSSIIRHAACTPRRPGGETNHPAEGEKETALKYLTN